MSDSLPELIETLAAFNGYSPEDADERLNLALSGTHEALLCYGIAISKDSLAPELRRLNKRVNRGRARKVSVKRPSPQLSREKMTVLHVQARLNTLARVLDAGKLPDLRRANRRRS